MKAGRGHRRVGERKLTKMLNVNPTISIVILSVKVYFKLSI